MLNLPCLPVATADRFGIVRAKRSLILKTFILFSLGPVPGWPAASPAKTPLVSAPAPDFVLKSSTAQNLRLSEFRGEVVIMNFWSSDCRRCRKQLERLAEIGKANRPDRMSILSVNVDGDSSKTRRVIADQSLPFPVLFDSQKKVVRLYDPDRLPMTVMIDPHGTVRFIHEGYQSGDEAQYVQEIAELLAE